MGEPSIRLLLVDDHAILRHGLRALLQRHPEFEVVAEASGAEEALSLLRHGTVADVVLLDISLPGMNGFDCLRVLRSEFPELRVLVLTMHDDVNYLREALRAGASGYLPKQAADRELFAALAAVASGEIYVHPDMNRRLILDMAQRSRESRSPPPSVLSEREQEVLRAIALGYTNQEIAQRLGLSIKTVETYKERIAEKLGLRRRFELVRYALDAGLINTG